MKNLKMQSLMALFAVALIPSLTSAQIYVGGNASGSADGSVDSAADANAVISTETVVTIGNAEATSTEETDDMEVGVSSDTALMLSASGLPIRTAADVSADEDLEAFSYNAAMEAENVESVNIETDGKEATKVEVSYNHTGKLFGFIPVTIRSTNLVTVAADGQVEVASDMPWWNVLVTNINHVESDVETRLEDNPTIMANAEAALNARAKAEIAEAIIAELDAQANVYAELNN